MQLHSGMRLKGTLIIKVRDSRTNRVLKTIRKRNCITLDASDIVRSLLAQRTPPADLAPAANAWGSMRFGVTPAVAPVRADVDLVNEDATLRKELTDAKKVDGIRGVITLLATMEAGEGNGNTYCEAGVFSRGTGVPPTGGYDDDVGVNGVRMYSRQIHTAILKSAALRLEYSWVMEFTA